MGITSGPGGPLQAEAADAYIGYLREAYGFERAAVDVPEAYSGRELDWFGDLNDVLTELEDYSPEEARRILTARNPWIPGGGSLLSALRSGDGGQVRRILKRY